MTESKITELLPLPDGVAKPHAYQVFGLQPGEQDNEKVMAAMRRVYANLKESRESCDPTVWQKAAGIAEAARKVLEDPQRRRELDARFGIVSPAQVSRESESVLEENDPLAGVLPQTDPMSASGIGVAASGSGSGIALGTPPSGAAPLGSPPMGTPPATAPIAGSSEAIADSGPQTASQPQPTQGANAVGWTPPKSKGRRRRKKKTGTYLFAGFVLALIGGVVGLLFYFADGNQIVLNETGDAGDDGRVVSPPLEAPNGQARPPQPPSDGVLGNVAQSGVASSIQNNTPQTLPIDDNSFLPMAAGDDDPAMAFDPGPGNDPDPDNNASAADPEMTTTPSEPMAPSEDVVKKNQAEIDSLAEMIRSADWDKMKRRAEEIRKLQLNETQMARADTLYDIADLASFYRGAIQRGMAGLETGSTFEITTGLSVVVVEASDSALTIRYDRKNKSFLLDELPPRLTEQLAAFALERERPDSIAGLALYRLIHPDTNPEYRKKAFQQLESVDGQLEGVDTEMLRSVATELFAS